MEAVGERTGAAHRPGAMGARDPVRRAPLALGAEHSPAEVRSDRSIRIAAIEISDGAVDASPAAPAAIAGMGLRCQKVRLAPQLAAMAAVDPSRARGVTSVSAL